MEKIGVILCYLDGIVKIAGYVFLLTGLIVASILLIGLIRIAYRDFKDMDLW